MGAKYYFTGKPCKSGHLSKRHISGNCVACAITLTKKWRDKNPDKVQAQNLKTYWSDPEHHRARTTKFRCENPSIAQARLNDWRDKNPDKMHKSHKLWLQNNNSRVRSYRSKRREQKRVGSFSNADIIRILKFQKNKCAEPSCRKDLTEGYHVDHIMPLSKGGANTANNIQCLCRFCNLSKGSKHPSDWARLKGRLF